VDAPARNGKLDASPVSEALPLAVPALLGEALVGKRFAVVGFDPDEAARIVAVIEAVNGFARIVRLPSITASTTIFASYEACVIRAVPAIECGYSSAELIAQCGKPTLVIGTREEILSQFSAARVIPYDFLFDPWDVNDLMLRSFRLISARAEARQGAPISNDNDCILIADDDTTIRMMVSTILRNSEMRCEIACDGYEAIEMARTLSPRVAILDINMPRMDGFEVLSAVKGDPSTRAVRVVMLSARQHETDVVRGFALGADDYVTKPFSPMELVARVRRALRS
jgi:CheY-like chemotaxis protein